MKAKLIYHSKDVDYNGDILEIAIWEVPISKDKPHGFKYSMAYMANNKRVIGYDNAEGKGDHRHIKDKEFTYKFKSIDKLFDDFKNDIKRFKEGKI